MSSIRRGLLWTLGPGLVVAFVAAGFGLHAFVEGRLRHDDARSLIATLNRMQNGVSLEIAPESRLEIEGLSARARTDPQAREALRARAREALRVRIHAEVLAAATAPGDLYRVLQQPGDLLHEGGVIPGALRSPTQTVFTNVEDVPFADPGWQARWATLRGEDPALRRSVTLSLTRSIARRTTFVTTLLNALLLVGLGLAIVTAAWTTWRVARGLRPVRRLGTAVAALRPDALDLGLGTGEVPDELRPLVGALNGALTRIQAGVERERRTTAYIAHELRTPLAELRSVTEIAARQPDNVDIQNHARTEAHAVALEMEAMVGALLQLSRLEQGQVPGTAERVDLMDLLRTEVSHQEGAAAARGIHIDVTSGEGAAAHASRELLVLIVRNLVTNAIQHAPEGSTTQATASTLGAEVRVEVRNPAPDLRPEDLVHLATPFWRADPARKHTTHAGLGLALAAEAARALGGRLAHTLASETDELVATLVLPAA